MTEHPSCEGCLHLNHVGHDEFDDEKKEYVPIPSCTRYPQIRQTIYRCGEFKSKAGAELWENVVYNPYRSV